MTAAPLPSMRLSRSERDRQLSPSLSAKDAAGVLARHAAATAALWDAPDLDCLRDRAYGAAPRARLDLVRPAGDGSFPCVAFVHGGFWQEGARDGSGFAALALARAGWASALIGYTLAPAARLPAIADEIAQAIGLLHRQAGPLRLDPARLVLAGHSAGAHLAAALICGKTRPEIAGQIAGAVLVSGVYDLAPVAASYVNDAVGLDNAKVEALSLLDSRPTGRPRVHVLIGADEPEAFQEQSLALCQAWSRAKVAVSYRQVAGRDHFDILDELADPHSASFAAIMEMGK